MRTEIRNKRVRKEQECEHIRYRKVAAPQATATPLARAFRQPLLSLTG